MNIKNIMPTSWLLISIIIMIVFHLLAPAMTIISSLWRLLGIIPIVIGLVVNLMADKEFHLAKTTVKPFEESSALITRAAFSFSRNPMYLGFTLILLGIAILLGSLSPYIVIPIFVILLDRVFISEEELMLADKFGAEWEIYKQKTRRWM